jgi:hypothetical protein
LGDYAVELLEPVFASERDEQLADAYLAGAYVDEPNVDDAAALTSAFAKLAESLEEETLTSSELLADFAGGAAGPLKQLGRYTRHHPGFQISAPPEAPGINKLANQGRVNPVLPIPRPPKQVFPALPNPWVYPNDIAPIVSDLPRRHNPDAVVGPPISPWPSNPGSPSSINSGMPGHTPGTPSSGGGFIPPNTYVPESPPENAIALHNPEPPALAVWTLLACGSALYARLRRR